LRRSVTASTRTREEINAGTLKALAHNGDRPLKEWPRRPKKMVAASEEAYRRVLRQAGLSVSTH
jgi:hypothetical protein